MVIENAQLYMPDHTFRKGSLSIEGEFIRQIYTGQATGSAQDPAVTPQATGSAQDPAVTPQAIDAEGCYVIPGLIDIHLHGCLGVDFCDATQATLDTMAGYLLENGITGFTPATMTLSPEELHKVFTAAGNYTNDTGATFLGIHMEGPYFSEKKKGAQKGDNLRQPSLAEFHALQDACGGRITQVDVAPELPGALDFIREASRTVTVSLGHSAAGYDTAMAGFQAGASHVTHLFNGMMPFAHREPGLAGAAADFDGCLVEMICDGIHIHPAMIRSMFRLFGPERILLISDSMMAAGMPDGHYSLGGQDVAVCSGKATLADGTIAGSAVCLMDCLRRAVSFGIPLADAVRCASENQAKELGLFDQLGSLTAGKYADLVLLRPDDLSVRAVIKRGEVQA